MFNVVEFDHNIMSFILTHFYFIIKRREGFYFNRK